MTKKTTARLIITKACNRRCGYCCNNYTSILEGATEIADLDEISDFDHVCITGGEPLLKLWYTLDIISEIRCNNPDVVVYLYTAYGGPIAWSPILDRVDGIHYTLHEGCTPEDIQSFYALQNNLIYYPGRKFRLYIHQSILSAIEIRPALWTRIESKPGTIESDCELPDHEKLFILKNK